MTLASGLDPGTHAGAHPLARYRSEFPIFRDKTYLNTCSLGALGERTRRRVTEFLDVWQQRGASAWYDVWWTALADQADAPRCRHTASNSATRRTAGRPPRTIRRGRHP